MSNGFVYEHQATENDAQETGVGKNCLAIILFTKRTGDTESLV